MIRRIFQDRINSIKWVTCSMEPLDLATTGITVNIYGVVKTHMPVIPELTQHP
jgi:hypothetical protein